MRTDKRSDRGAVNPIMTFALSGVMATGAAVLSQLGQVTTQPNWTETGAVGLLGGSSVLIVLGVLKGDILHVKSRDREDTLAHLVDRVEKLASQGHAREIVHEKFMTAAIDRLVEADRREPDR